MFTALRFLANLFFLVATLALVADMTPYLQGIGSIQLRAFSTHWSELSPLSLKAAEVSIENMLGTWAWSYLINPIISLPTAILFAIIGVICGYLGRRRKRTNVFIN